jgi:hypothetical protein
LLGRDWAAAQDIDRASKLGLFDFVHDDQCHTSLAAGRQPRRLLAPLRAPSVLGGRGP